MLYFCKVRRFFTGSIYFVSYIIAALAICINGSNQLLWASTADSTVLIDSRIKTFVYSEQEVFPVILNYGYQTSIEFAKGEKIHTYRVGNNYSWQISVTNFDNADTMFITPLEENILTNMTVITNKRKYYLDLYSKSAYDNANLELAYVVRFFYPDEASNSGADKLKINLEKKVMDEVNSDFEIKPYNFNYKIVSAKNQSKQAGGLLSKSKGNATAQIENSSLVPEVVFDDGIKTFFRFPNGVQAVPSIKVKGNMNNWQNITAVVKGKFLEVNTVGQGFILSYKNGDLVEISAK